MKAASASPQLSDDRSVVKGVDGVRGPILLPCLEGHQASQWPRLPQYVVALGLEGGAPLRQVTFAATVARRTSVACTLWIRHRCRIGRPVSTVGFCGSRPRRTALMVRHCCRWLALLLALSSARSLLRIVSSFNSVSANNFCCRAGELALVTSRAATVRFRQSSQ